MGSHLLKELYSCSRMMHGGVCVTLLGTTIMHLLSVISWATLQQVCVLVNCPSEPFQRHEEMYTDCSLVPSHLSLTILILSLYVTTIFTTDVYSVNFGEQLFPTITNLYCYGNESRLLECQYCTTRTSLRYCDGSEAVGVRCQGDIVSG